jgi:hypothetical protein
LGLGTALPSVLGPSYLTGFGLHPGRLGSVYNVGM